MSDEERVVGGTLSSSSSRSGGGDEGSSGGGLSGKLGSDSDEPFEVDTFSVLLSAAVSG